jgi:predicted lipoprotein with Yx(FWY)xxD motif
MRLLNTNLLLLTLSVTLLTAQAGMATTLGLTTLPTGNTILQATDAIAGTTGGGIASSDTRTLYFWAPDFGEPNPNAHNYMGPAWPYVYSDGAVTSDPAITAVVSTENDGIGDYITINGLPLYQFINDTSAIAANGNFGGWFWIEPNGTATQSPVPEPGTALLLGLGLAGFAAGGRRR